MASLFDFDPASIKGVRYNVIRRPLSGGRGTIVKHKPTKKNPQGESDTEYYDRLGKVIRAAVEPNGDHYFFMRWKIEVDQQDIDTFKVQCLDPVLEQVCEWYDWITDCAGDPFGNDRGIHFRFPNGVWNPLLEGRSSDLDEYLETGLLTGLRRVTNLFPELT